MRFNFRKIASVLASAVMLGSTVGIAAAATYPAPFVSGGAADSAVVVRSTTSGDVAGYASDWDAAIGLTSALQSKVTASTTSSSPTVSGEAYALFSDSQRIFINDSINTVRGVVTKSDLPTVLKDGTFSGNVDATTTSVITMGSNPQLTFAKQPTSENDPVLGVALSTTAGNYLYNASVSFNKAVNFTHTDSENQEITLFGQKFTVSTSTDTTNLVLFKEASRLNFDSSGTTSGEVTIGGKKYTVEMVSASTSAATIKVTNEAGATEQKEVNEGASKKINGLTVAINTADSNNLKYTASVIAGAEKVTLVDGDAVKIGDSSTPIEGTKAGITGGTTATTAITVSVYASESDKDAILAGQSYTDPVFGSFKIDFSGLNIASTNATNREEIKVANSGDDKLTVKMTDKSGNEKTIQFVYNSSTAALQWDTNGHNIIIGERIAVNYSDYVVVGNEDDGKLLKLTTATNASDGYSSDSFIFSDVFSGDQYTARLTAEGTGTVTIGGKDYTVVYNFANGLASEARTVRLQYPDSSAAGDMIVYPTIQTSKGAKVFFYKPLTIDLGTWDSGGTDATNLMFPNGADAYQSITAVPTLVTGNISINGVVLNLSGAPSSTTVTLTNTHLAWNFTISGINTTTIYLVDPEANANIVEPALVFFEEKDDNNIYEAVIITTEPGQDSTDGIGVSDIIRTWGNDNRWESIALASDSKKTQEMDLWGVIAQEDSADSDQKVATISYPDTQVYATVYVSAISAAISGGTTSAGGTVLTVKDSEVASVSSKNLIVVGGSCINTAAAKVLGSDVALCGADFTAKTNVGAGQYILKAVASPYNSAKTAILVAGYEAAETKLAVAKLQEAATVTDVGTSNVYPEVTTSA